MNNKPIKLDPTNFTPLARTPWAGKVISQRYKAEVAPDRVGEAVGESWEFSCDPSFPSRIVGAEKTLPQLIAESPRDILGERLSGDGAVSSEILVKLLNAAMPLSLQVHPSDDDTNLGKHECGKPESWLVLSAEQGSGLYLGFNRPLSKQELAELLVDGDRAKEILQFVPVEAGDYFEIEPGVPHAVGPGLTLLEPQRILPGKSGKTYRLWDWGRRYDASGALDLEAGSPRELHLEAALELLEPESQHGPAFVDKIRRVAKVSSNDKRTWKSYPCNDHYQVHSFESFEDCQLDMNLNESYACLVMLAGEAKFNGEVVRVGEACLLPSIGWPVRATLSPGAHYAIVHPSDSELLCS